MDIQQIVVFMTQRLISVDYLLTTSFIFPAVLVLHHQQTDRLTRTPFAALLEELWGLSFWWVDAFVDPSKIVHSR